MALRSKWSVYSSIIWFDWAHLSKVSDIFLNHTTWVFLTKQNWRCQVLELALKAWRRCVLLFNNWPLINAGGCALFSKLHVTVNLEFYRRSWIHALSGCEVETAQSTSHCLSISFAIQFRQGEQSAARIEQIFVSPQQNFSLSDAS